MKPKGSLNHQIKLPGLKEEINYYQNFLLDKSIIKLRKKNHHICCYIFPKRLINEGLLPKEILINNRDFIRFYDRVYIPKKPTINDSSIIFDYLSPNYERHFIKDINFNFSVYKYLYKISKNPLGFSKDKNAINNILDLGCGTGLSSIAFKNLIENEKINLHGVDVSESMVNISKRRGIKAFHIKSTKLPFPNDYFESILGAFVSHFVWDNKSYKEILRILKPYGSLSMNIYKPSREWKVMYRNMLLSSGFSTVTFYKEEISTKVISRVIDFLVATK